MSKSSGRHLQKTKKLHDAHKECQSCHSQSGDVANDRQLGKNSCRRNSSLQCFDRGFVLQQDGDPIAYWVHPLALVAFQAFFAARHERLATYGAHENLEKFRGNHDGRIVAGEPLFAIRFSSRRPSEITSVTSTRNEEQKAKSEGRLVSPR